jgi:hypothetical protein
MQNILSTPLLIPKIEPISWSTWWELWYAESKPVIKLQSNHNNNYAPWRGFDIWVKAGINADEYTNYKLKNLNCIDLFPSIFNNLDKFPIDIDIVRVVSSLGPVAPHTDSSSKILSVRTIIYDNNIYPNFYYLKGDKKIYQSLPLDTNTWVYWDDQIKHGTDWYQGHSKILIMYYGKIKTNAGEELIDKSADNYQDYVIFVD